MNGAELNTQNKLLLKTLFDFYKKGENLNKLLGIVNGDSRISLRIVDWFVTNYAKKNYIVYNDRFKVYNDYKLKLKAYSKKRFDPFCRWERIYIPYCRSQRSWRRSGRRRGRTRRTATSARWRPPSGS